MLLQNPLDWLLTILLPDRLTSAVVAKRFLLLVHFYTRSVASVPGQPG